MVQGLEFINDSEEPIVVSIEPYCDEFTLEPSHACKFSYSGELYAEPENHNWTVTYAKDCIVVFAPGLGTPQVKLGRRVPGNPKIEYDETYLFEDGPLPFRHRVFGVKRFFWISLAIALALYAAMIFVTMPNLMEMSGGLAPFDMRPMGYSLAEAEALLSALGDEGRSYYRETQQMLDLIFPGAMAVALMSGGWLLIGRPWFWGFAFLTLLAKGSDYLENHAVAGLLDNGAVEVTVAVASRFTVVKSIGDVAAYTWLAVAFGLYCWRRFVQRNSS